MTGEWRLPCGCVVEPGKELYEWKLLVPCGRRCIVDQTVGRDITPARAGKGR